MLTWCCFCCQGHENEKTYIATQGKHCSWSTVSSVRSKMVSTCSGKPIITLSTSLPFMQRVNCWPDWQLSYFVLSLQSVDLCLFLCLSPLGHRWRDGLGLWLRATSRCAQHVRWYAETGLIWWTSVFVVCYHSCNFLIFKHDFLLLLSSFSFTDCLYIFMEDFL